MLMNTLPPNSVIIRPDSIEKNKENPSILFFITCHVIGMD